MKKAQEKSVQKSPVKRKTYSDKIVWADIRDEYVTQGTGIRALSRKYGVPATTISHRAKRERWDDYGAELADKVYADSGIAERIIAQKLSNNEKAQQIIDALMDKLQTAVDKVNVHDAGSMKQLVTSMKDLKEIGAFETVKKDSEVIIKFGEETEEYVE